MRIQKALMTFLLISWPAAVLGSWAGPQEVVTGIWGKSPGQFYFEAGDAGDDFPRKFGVDNQGRIFISDEANARIQVFSTAGSLEKTITAPQGLNTSLGWPYDIYVNPAGALVASFDGPQKFFFDNSGNLINKVNVYGTAIPTSEGYVLEIDKTHYSLYSPAGQLIKTFTTMPAELGMVKSEKRGDNNYNITVTYPDKVFGLTSDRIFVRYARDTKGFVYGINAGGAWRFNGCGKLTGFVLIPSAQIIAIPRQGEGEPNVNVHEEYGEPVVAPNGDVYTWKRTPDKYSILKWTWVDDPNVPTGPDAPTNLSLTPSINGLYLTWKASPNDPGCVTKYEIARSTTSGGSFSTIDTVEKGVLKYNDTTAEVGTTYYYKVRAMAGSDPSLYTSEVSGKR